MKSLKSIFALLTITMVFLLAACSGTEKDTSDDKKESEPTTEDTSYTVEHAMGSTTLEKTPERIVILTNEGTEALLSMGVTPVGAVQSWTGDPWYEHIADQMKDVEVIGLESQPTVEAIAVLKPDLIIGNKMRHEAIYEQLTAIAPTVFAETLRGDWQENFTLYSKAINKEEKGKEVLDNYNNHVAELKEKLGDKTSMEISMVRFMTGDVRIYHKDTFSGVIFEQLGFARPESQDVDDFAEKGVTKERIPAMEGDILFYFTYEVGDNEATALEEEWINDPLFKNLEVVKAGNIHKVSDTIWNTAGGVLAANQMLDEMEQIILK